MIASKSLFITRSVFPKSRGDGKYLFTFSLLRCMHDSNRLTTVTYELENYKVLTVLINLLNPTRTGVPIRFHKHSLWVASVRVAIWRCFDCNIITIVLVFIYTSERQFRAKDLYKWHFNSRTVIKWTIPLISHII